MQPIGLALVSLALVVAASASPLLNANSKTSVSDIPVFADYRPGDKCPARVFNDGCNTCICNDGINVACTLMDCPSYDEQKRSARSKLPVFPNYKVGDKCPAKHFNDGCNDCVCGADGVTAACTLKACLNFDGQKRAVRSDKIPVFPTYKFGDKCPAKVFNDGCNSCVCGNDGVTVACTLKLCPEKRQTRANAQSIPVVYGYQQGDECPAQQFFDDCNRCACANDGHSAACTRMACPLSRETSSVPELPVVYGYKYGDKCPAQRFIDDCNICACSADGHSAACTLMACPPRREARSVSDVPVVQGYKQGDKCPAQQFFDKCNRCFCAADGHSADCTMMACPDILRTVVPHIDNFDEIKKCTPNQHFQKKCNGCICGADGASAVCTLMLCAE